MWVSMWEGRRGVEWKSELSKTQTLFLRIHHEFPVPEASKIAKSYVREVNAIKQHITEVK